MKEEELLEAIGRISSETVERNALGATGRNVFTVKNIRKWVAIAASLAVVVGAGLFACRQYMGSTDGEQGGQIDMAQGMSAGGETAQNKESAGGERDDLFQKEMSAGKEQDNPGGQEYGTEEGQTPDVPVDESVYQEAHKYSEEIEAIQYAISQAMTAGELPFVTSSAIYEDPVRIVVTVNSREEADLEKLRAYDTAGGVIEVVYSEEEIHSKTEAYQKAR